jgi:valyl-tRNA synthetase
VDISGEKARLEKELGKISKDLEQCSKKLANRDFRAKAAPEIIQKEEDKLKELKKKFATLEGALKKLKGLSG